MQSYGKTPREYGLPEPDERGNDWQNRAMPVNQNDLTPQQHQEILNNLEPTLNVEQRVSNQFFY